MKILDNGIIREMTQEEINAIAEPEDPNHEQLSDAELLSILMGETE